MRSKRVETARSDEILKQVLSDWPLDGESWTPERTTATTEFPVSVEVPCTSTEALLAETPYVTSEALSQNLMSLQCKMSETPTGLPLTQNQHGIIGLQAHSQEELRAQGMGGYGIDLQSTPEKITVALHPQQVMAYSSQKFDLGSSQPSQEMEVDSGSVASTSTQILGKRKKMDRGSEMEDNDPTPQVRRSSRTTRAACIVTDDERRQVGTGGNALGRQKNMDTSDATYQCSDAEGMKVPIRVIKKSRRRRGSKEPTIEERLRPLPASADELRIAPAAQVSVSALEWIEDIDTIRIGSGSLQGGLSGQIRKRVTILSEVIRTLSERIEDSGDPAYLRRRNVELAAELAASKRETDRLRRDVTDLQRIVQDLKSSMGYGSRNRAGGNNSRRLPPRLILRP